MLPNRKATKLKSKKPINPQFIAPIMAMARAMLSNTLRLIVILLPLFLFNVYGYCSQKNENLYIQIFYKRIDLQMVLCYPNSV